MNSRPTIRMHLRPGSARRRGAVYLAILGVSMIITVIGVSAVLASRVQTRMADSARRAQNAQHAAQSAIEFARLQIKNNAAWRSTYSNNTWVSDVTFAQATFTFKLVDEIDGNLANDVTQPVRLHGKASSGSATRLLSVELAPDASNRMVPVSGTWRQEVQ